jgi:YidC/Oxa1 family membrane protein insertase
MDMYRAFLAIILSFLILLGYQYFFTPTAQPPAPVQTEQQQGAADQPAPVTTGPAPPAGAAAPAVPATVPVQPAPTIAVDENARDIVVDTPLYTAVFFEQGGGLKSFVLKKYRVAREEDAPPMEMVTTSNPAEFPMVFSLDNGVTVPLFKAEQEALHLNKGELGKLRMSTTLANGVTIERELGFDAATYLISSSYTVTNTGSAPLQVTPAFTMSNEPYKSGSTSSRYLFSGPAIYVNGELQQIKAKKMATGSQILQGRISWSAYEDNYFMTALIPTPSNTGMVTVSAVADNTIRTVITDGTNSLTAGESKIYQYHAYVGPKKLAYLKGLGFELSEAINFGWFDVLAKPMLFLLNFFYTYIGNYGIAIILLTCLIKGAFWPITQKGMKSMKNMQKLQPKVAKLKEKFKDDPAKMNQEMMAMYKTYKVNPIGGCLPMVIQIPFFFALYRVLMAAIELRHAPFMLWINDLSAPDRLMIGFDIPVLHGIPVLTLLMGASMYLQQKMTPTTADPTQAKIMQFLPIIFTFMFINFASGLVLYWFVNNLLSILQQQLINRQVSKEKLI